MGCHVYELRVCALCVLIMCVHCACVSCAFFTRISYGHYTNKLCFVTGMKMVRKGKMIAVVVFSCLVSTLTAGPLLFPVITTASLPPPPTYWDASKQMILATLPSGCQLTNGNTLLSCHRSAKFPVLDEQYAAKIVEM